MEHAATKEEEECGICLDALKNPVALPCSHKFCSECLNGWRSKYGASVRSEDDKMDRKCPLCREEIPPSKEMIAQLKFWRERKSDLEAKGEFFSERYRTAKSRIEELECDIGDWGETIDYSDDKHCVLPTAICKAASANDIQKVLDWLGPLPVDKQRVNAKDPETMNYTLVFVAAVMHRNSDLLSILLQFGADVDAVDANGHTTLGILASLPKCYTQARLLLEWGAEISNCPCYTSKDECIKEALLKGNSKLANLMKSEFGGRRCEIVDLPNHPDLIGKTCVVEKYLPAKGRYKVVFEASGEVGLVGPKNLKRRDRTPYDCGYYIIYENGRTSRHEFTSREVCQTFLASMAEDKKSGDGVNDGEAETRAEQAAASLLAELDIESSADAKTRGKKKSKKKGRK